MLDIAESIMREHFEDVWNLDDILETLEDYWLLNAKWKKVRKKIWGITWKNTSDYSTEKDRMLYAWNWFSEYTKRVLLKDYKTWYMNRKWANFIKKYILKWKV